ncbi:hypothetical protein [Salinispora tropica]|uniref:Uncharacterized protein n=1 Tax=Salinispora tropica (strain ATCC BAA-916 / DSM 44818 / JCM 13857 / NBRC 105044 / CNB-440) TaxID=369723 RepID=A4X267_SALTO|nr:hypothetical protein [Salinispora tropica]ABP52967.1 hypothetical protein Strop_0482 [Salinispora tropica CNB-440]
MTDAAETFVHPEGVRAGAGQLGAAGSMLARRWAQHAATIEMLNGNSPWGADEYGKEFNKHYLGGDAIATTVLDGGQTIVERVQLLGPIVSSAVDGTVEMDEAVRTMFGSDDT